LFLSCPSRIVLKFRLLKDRGVLEKVKTYRAFHRFGQAKFPDGEPIFKSAPAASK
jgi:hypothetical protein